MGILKRIVAGLAVNALALYVVMYVLESVEYTGGWKFFVLGGVIIGFLNLFVKPFLKLLTFPFLVLSAGLFLIPINAVILWLAKGIINTLSISDIQFLISGWSNYLIAAVMFGLVNWFIHIFIKSK